MKDYILIAIFVLVVFSCVLYSCTYVENKVINYNYTPNTNAVLNQNEVELIRLINDHRDSIGLKRLIPEKLACDVCLNQNMEDIENDEIPNHDNWNIMLNECYVNQGNGGQIEGYGYNSPNGLFMAYMTSNLGHREVIENPNRTHIGVSLVNKRNYCLIIKY